MLPDATQIADPFHVVKLANFVLDEVRRRVRNETCGHRGRKTDPHYRSRKLMTIDLQDDSCPPELRRLGRTITKWRLPIAAWHQAKFTNGPTEAVNNLIKRVKRVAFGITNWTNYRTRSTALRRQPDWSLLNPNPRCNPKHRKWSMTPCVR